MSWFIWPRWAGFSTNWLLWFLEITCLFDWRVVKKPASRLRIWLCRPNFHCLRRRMSNCHCSLVRRKSGGNFLRVMHLLLLLDLSHSLPLRSQDRNSGWRWHGMNFNTLWNSALNAETLWQSLSMTIFWHSQIQSSRIRIVLGSENYV